MDKRNNNRLKIRAAMLRGTEAHRNSAVNARGAFKAVENRGIAS